jgi:hypothetical protein
MYIFLRILLILTHAVLEYSLQCQRLPIKRQKLTELDGVMVIGVHSITYLVICVTAVSLTVSPNTGS